MKVFWWQGGIHAEPETAEEGKAMRVLYDSVKRWNIAADGIEGQPKTGPGASLDSGVLPEKVPELLVADE